MPEPERFAELLESLADGTPVDWTAVESATTSDDDRAWLQQLRRLELAVVRQRRTPVRGATWSHLDLIERIGTGAFGEVYRAHDPRLARDVALKLLYEPMRADDARASAVIEEGRLLARVRHPNVVTVYGAECRDGQVGIWTEFIDGQTLQAIVSERGPLPRDEVVSIGVDLCRALAAVHAAGLLHRDIKAQNVMREAGGRIVLMDFGTGRDLDPLPGQKTDVSGTPLYLAPELFTGGEASAASDIYALGVLLFFLLTGKYPVSGRTLTDVRDGHLTGSAPSLRDLEPAAPAALVTAIDHALSRAPSRRFVSAREFEQALVGAQPAVSVGHAGQQRSMSQRRHGYLRFAAALALLVVGAGAAWWALAHRSAEPASTGSGPLGLIGKTGSTGDVTAASPSAVASQDAPTSVAPAAPDPREARVSTGSGSAVGVRMSVLVAAFANNTGDHQLDGVMEVALQRELVNSRFVNVVAQDRIDRVLTLMQKPLDTPLNTITARELALRDGAIGTVVEGELERTDDGYAVTARVIAASDGRISPNVREVAADAQALHTAVRRVSNRLRAALGEARNDIQAGESRLEQVTTVSFYALKHYSDSWTLGFREDWVGALSRIRLAVEEDPQFASARIWLAWCLQHRSPGGGYTPEVAAVAEEAIRLAPHALDWERHWIEGSAAVMGDDPAKRHEAVASFKALLDLVPTHYWGLNNLITALRDDFRVREAVPYALAAIRLEPNNFGLVRRTFSLLGEVCDVGNADPLVDRLRELSLRDKVDVPLGVSWFPVQRAMCRLDIRGTAWELDSLEASLLNLQGPARAATFKFLKDWNLGLGRLRAIARLSETVGPPLGRAYLGASAAFFADDDPAFRTELASVPLDFPAKEVADARPYGFTVYETLFYLVRADRVHDVEPVLAKTDSSIPATRAAFDTTQACMSLARGDLDRAIVLLANVHAATVAAPDWADECYVDALVRRGRINDAIVVLQRWEAAQCPTPAIEAYRTRYLVRLAELYHQAGRDPAARSLVTYLATILGQADPNFPLRERVRILERTPGVSVH